MFGQLSKKEFLNFKNSLSWFQSFLSEYDILYDDVCRAAAHDLIEDARSVVSIEPDSYGVDITYDTEVCHCCSNHRSKHISWTEIEKWVMEQWEYEQQRKNRNL